MDQGNKQIVTLFEILKTLADNTISGRKGDLGILATTYLRHSELLREKQSNPRVPIAPHKSPDVQESTPAHLSPLLGTAGSQDNLQASTAGHKKPVSPLASSPITHITCPSTDHYSGSPVPIYGKSRIDLKNSLAFFHWKTPPPTSGTAGLFTLPRSRACALAADEQPVF